MKKLLIPAAVLVVAACTQEPVNVVLKGSQFFGRGNQTLAGKNTGTENYVAWSDQLSSPARLEFQEEPATQPQRVGQVGVSDLPPLRAEDPASAKLAVIQRDISEIKLIPSGAPAKDEGARFAPASMQVESPVRATEVEKDWYQGRITLAKTEGEKPDAPRFIWPVRGKIVSHFGPKANGLHNDGINISAHLGDPVYAAADGVVVYAGNDLKGYGNMVIVRHENGWMTAYAHTDRLLVMENERISQGQRIATVGATGSVDSAQLHFGLRNGKNPVDPARFLNSDYAAR